MKIELTPARTTDVDRLVAIHASAFPDARGYPERRANFQDNPRGPLSDLFVARSPSGAIVGHAFLFRMRTWIAGGEVALSGLASVAVAPEARGQGVGRAIVTGLLDESHRRGDALQLLWPFAYSFYASLGFAAVAPIVRLRAPSGSLPRSDLATRCVRATAADVPAIAAMYARTAPKRNGFVTRSDALFTRLLGVPGNVAFLVRGEHDEVCGWVLFRFVEVATAFATELHVRELVAVDVESERALLALVAAHRDQVDAVELSLSPDDPLPMLLSEPRAPRAPVVPEHLHPLGRLAAGPMVRPIDVPRLLSQRGYLQDGRVALRVADARGDVALALAVVDRKPNVKVGDAPPDALELDVATLGAIAVGALRPSDARRHGLLRGGEDEAAGADRLFATHAPFRCLDEF